MRLTSKGLLLSIFWLTNCDVMIEGAASTLCTLTGGRGKNFAYYICAGTGSYDFRLGWSSKSMKYALIFVKCLFIEHPKAIM